MSNPVKGIQKPGAIAAVTFAVAAVLSLRICSGPVWAQGGDTSANGDGSSAPVARQVTVAEEIPIHYAPVIVSEIFTAGVVRVLDDRTVVVHRDDRNRNETVRLFGVAPLASAAPDGQSARAYLTEHLKSARVRVEGRSRDHSGMLSAIVTLVAPPPPNRLVQAREASGISNDAPYGAAIQTPRPPQPEKSLNETIVRMGLARYDAIQAPDETALADAESDAQKSRKGYWSTVSTATATSAERP